MNEKNIERTRANISIIIPTFNGRHLLEKNLPAVLGELGDGDELIIIEDAGNDDTLEWLEKNIKSKVNAKDAQLKVIKNKKNLRFGASCNKGVRLAKHKLIMLLNNDVSPHHGAFNQLASHFSDPEVFAVGCLEIEKIDGKENYHGKNRLWFEQGIFRHEKTKNLTSGATAWVIGGSGMFDRIKWLELGGFDKRYYPAYWEDIDLSFRAKKRGWKVLFDAKAVVDHNHESTNIDVFGQKNLDKISWKNILKFTWKNSNFWQKIAFIIWRPLWIYRRLKR